MKVSIAPLVIDFSTMQDTDKHHSSFHHEATKLISWVKSYPRRADIHIYLKSSITSASNRKLQSTLQSLGCRVTARTSYASILK